MKVFVKANFDLSGMLGANCLEIPDGSSMRLFLQRIGKQIHLDLIDRNKDEINGSDFTILLNGKEHIFWPEGLGTCLREADEVQIRVMPLAGG